MIKDEFTDLPVSRQRRYQMRKLKEGRCTLCGKPATFRGSHCLKHLVDQREKQRERLGSKKRYRSKSYRMSQAQ